MIIIYGKINIDAFFELSLKKCDKDTSVNEKRRRKEETMRLKMTVGRKTEGETVKCVCVCETLIKMCNQIL